MITPFALTWIIVSLFGGIVAWGMNVPTQRRSVIVAWLVGIAVVFSIIAQSYLLKISVSNVSSSETKQMAAQASEGFQHFLSAVSYQPGTLTSYPVYGWYRLITSTLLHYGWVHLAVNLWYLVLFGHVLECTVGRGRFLMFVMAGLLVPALLDGLLSLSATTSTVVGGMSGIIYTMMGACLMMFPRSRVFVAVNYDLRFWGAIFCILLPVTYIAHLASMALSEMVLIMGFLAAFLLIQPEHMRVSIPLVAAIIFKFLLDCLLVQPFVSSVLSNSLWRIGGGLLIGLAGGYLVSGRSGWSRKWGEEKPTKTSRARAGSRSRVSVATLEAEGHKTEEGARIYLGQRVFVGDAPKAIAFYRDVVMTKFPDMMLPLQEQISLARLLHFKGCDKEALHAYETLISGVPVLPDEYWIAWLKAAELTVQVQPENTYKARKYLDHFEQGTTVLMRDKIEAQRLRAELPVVEEAASPSLPVPMPISDSQNDTPESDAEASMDFPRIRPRTFVYVPNAAPVSLVDAKIKLPEPSLADKDHLNTHWKPLPSMADKISEGVALLDKRVKSTRYIEETDAPSYYSDGKTSSGFPIGKTRLGRLELMDIRQPETTAARDMPGSYGGLADYPGGLDSITRIRLRGEPADKPAPRNRRPRPREPEDYTQWTTLTPSSNAEKVENGPDKTYGETDNTGESIASGSQDGLSAVVLLDANQNESAMEFWAAHPDLAENYPALPKRETGERAPGLFLLRKVPNADLPTIEEKLREAGLAFASVAESDPVLHMEPVEVLGIVVDDSGCTFRTGFGNRRISWDEPRFVSLCRMKLTSTSRTLPRLMLDIYVPGNPAVRYQAFERTVVLRNSKVDDKTFSEVEELMLASWAKILVRVKKNTIIPDTGSKSLPVYDSYQQYDDTAMRTILRHRGSGGTLL